MHVAVSVLKNTMVFAVVVLVMKITTSYIAPTSITVIDLNLPTEQFNGTGPKMVARKLATKWEINAKHLLWQTTFVAILFQDFNIWSLLPHAIRVLSKTLEVLGTMHISIRRNLRSPQRNQFDLQLQSGDF
jgi:hypothetical protein